jgi:N-acetylglucosaminyl-diphospho-decaprenol L-rhamnosyltransferase
MMPPVLTVAVVNYETPALTAACVRSVLDAPPAEPYEVVVVDNGSSAPTVAALEAIDGARLVATGVNGGFAAAVNRCLAEADAASDVVVVLNSDTELEPGALDALATTARADRVGLAAPVLLEPDGGVQCSAFDRAPSLWTTWTTLCLPFASAWMRIAPSARPAALTVEQHEAGARPLHVSGAAMALRRAAWDATGPFDERYFMYFEETEWQLRMHRAGWDVALEPRARVRHLHRAGELTAVVPPLVYLDSARVYFGAQGHRDLVTRLTLASAILLTYLALLLYLPLARRVPAHRELVPASLGPARRAVLHLLLGRRVPRPAATGA